MFRSLVALVSLLVASLTLLSRSSFAAEKELRVSLDEDAGTYVRFVPFVQLWARTTELNPGSEVEGRPQNVSSDFVLRRARLLTYAQVTPDLFTVLHVGVTSQSFRQFDAEFALYDAYVEQRLVARSAFRLHAGAGLHSWQAFSRAASAGALTLVPLDVALVAFPNVNATDRFGRRLGVFVKRALVERLRYRWALTRPFNRGEGVYGTPTPGGATLFNGQANALSTGGYLEWQFLELESDLLPFRQGSYYGSKRVLNLGIGYSFHPGAMVNAATNGERRTYSSHLLGADYYMELPQTFYDAGTLTTYLSYAYQDMGPNYVRHLGIANIADSGVGGALSGGGNAAPVSGTGHHLHGELGYLFALPIGGLQPYAVTSMSWFDAYRGVSPNLGAGLNYLPPGDRLKLTLHYQARPIWLDPDGIDRFANEVILQTQLHL
jgi:hypothetical protein